MKWSRTWSGKVYGVKGHHIVKGWQCYLEKNQTFEISNEVIDSNGRLVVFDITINNAKFRIINIYAPTQEYERVNFFNEMNDFMADNNDVETIIRGDYNCTLNNEADRYNYTSTIDIGQIDLKYFIENYDLEDVWSKRNPNKRHSLGMAGVKALELTTGLFQNP